jgi:hypothetical protein
VRTTLSELRPAGTAAKLPSKALTAGVLYGTARQLAEKALLRGKAGFIAKHLRTA